MKWYIKALSIGRFLKWSYFKWWDVREVVKASKEASKMRIEHDKLKLNHRAKDFKTAISKIWSYYSLSKYCLWIWDFGFEVYGQSCRDLIE